MADEYTPSVATVRDAYASHESEYLGDNGYRKQAAEFDRMIAAVERAAAVKALREVAIRWQTGAWAYAPRSSDVVADRMKAAQFTTKWLNSEADRIESGGQA
jgi:hypothetical protein